MAPGAAMVNTDYVISANHANWLDDSDHARLDPDNHTALDRKRGALMTTLIQHGDVVTPSGIISDGSVLIDGRRIVAVGQRDEIAHDPSVEERIDAGGRIIAPGFIDIQLNGANGRLLTNEPSVDTVLMMAKVLPQFGCTSFLPTAITATPDRLMAAANAVAEAQTAEHPGATILGLHVEGPFLNPGRAGAHRRDMILPPSVELLRRLSQASLGCHRLLTLAPEMPGALEVIELAIHLGITVALGHTNATPAEIDRAADRGVTLATHLFNAMAQLGSRVPGTVGGVLANDRLSASVIADCVHVDPVSLNVAVRAKGPNRIILITDGMPPIGTTDDHFVLDGEQIEVRDGACYRSDGVLAGSALTMNAAVRNMVTAVGVPLDAAIAMASLNPARVAGVADHQGSLEPGKDADVVIIDRDVNVWMTMVEGRIRHLSSEMTVERDGPGPNECAM